MNRPPIKYLKFQVPDILEGFKTLDPRPRSASWIDRIEKAGIGSNWKDRVTLDFIQDYTSWYKRIRQRLIRRLDLF